MKPILIIAATALLFSECKKRELASSSNLDTLSEAREKDVTLEIDTTRKTLITDNSFISRAEKDLTLERFKSLYNPKETSKAILQNKYSSEKRDTIVSYSEGKDSISFYIAPLKSFPYKLIIASDMVTIDRDIKVGMIKDLFKKRFQISKMEDVVVVRDMAGYFRYTFTFGHGRLTKIVFEALIIE